MLTSTTLPTFEEAYEQQLKEKFERLTTLLIASHAPPLSIHRSPDKAFRFRAEFAIWHEGEDLYYTMRDKFSGEAITIEHYPIGSTLIQQAMPLLKEKLVHNEILRKKLFQVEFLSSRLGHLLISLIYHKPLNDAWREQAILLKNELQLIFKNLQVIGRSRKQKISIENDYIKESFTVRGTSYLYQQTENGFTQPNAFVNEQMLNWVAEVTKNIGGDLLELYCGNGNFTLPLSKNFHKVLATEVSKTSIKSLHANLLGNNINNVYVARLSGEESTQAIRGVRPFKRLAHINLDDFQFNTVLVDPPRAGLDQQTLDFLKDFDHICYISCNPASLVENLKHLTQTHQIKQAALFDQFPHTNHIESGVLLSKK